MSRTGRISQKVTVSDSGGKKKKKKREREILSTVMFTCLNLQKRKDNCPEPVYSRFRFASCWVKWPIVSYVI
jgi:hypothetical protein